MCILDYRYFSLKIASPHCPRLAARQDKVPDTSMHHVTIACSNSVAGHIPSVIQTRIFTLAISTAALHTSSLRLSPARLSLRSRVFRQSNPAGFSDAKPSKYAVRQRTLTVAFLSRLTNLNFCVPNLTLSELSSLLATNVPFQILASLPFMHIFRIL